MFVLSVINILNYNFQAIQEQLNQHGQEPVSFQDVKDEIFDMVKPANPSVITLQDLLNRYAHLHICNHFYLSIYMNKCYQIYLV